MITFTSAGAATFSGALSGTSAYFTGNVGAGVSSDINSNFRLNIKSPSGNGGIVFQPDTDGATVPVLRMLNAGLTAAVAEIGTNSGSSFYISTAGTSRLTIASTGAATFSSSVTATSLLINGGTTANFVFAVESNSTFAFGSTNGKRIGYINSNSGDKPGIQFGYDATDNTGIIAGSTQATGAGIDFYTYNGSAWGNRMRITSGGSILIGTTTTTGIPTGASTNQGISLGSGTISSQVNNNSNQYWSKATGYTSGDFTAHFVNNVYVGGISTNGSSTTYATASDYRLKHDLKSFNGIDLINLIKTYDFAWKTDNSRMYGVIAHEFLEVLPYAVTGVKDGEMMQGVDYSKLTPILVKAIQEQQQQIEQLKAKLI